ncbi:hypothetical protein [Dyadobacter aurulentus]|uniref:hypothetical protein n=1 Tax=Dyadobacter sp. UC 10 TaxID=2605428 RepID=UPI0011F24660|nr:hypothetical protein [Dyadobacter sp. UC 10]KAA0991440.1 hypothetical protein FXO21_15340 [Dyadobacter sp. UC 10]
MEKTDDPQVGARLVQDAHISYPTYKSDFAKQADAELKATGNDSKLSEMNEIAHPRIIDSLYALYFREFVIENGFQKPLTERYRSALKSYASNDYKYTFVRSGLSHKLLLNAGLIESDDAESISFYANELIDSRMGEYSLILRCLDKIKGSISAIEFRSMKSRLAQQIEESKIDEVELEKNIKLMIAEKEAFFEKNPNIKEGRIFLEGWKAIGFGKRRENLNNLSDRLSKF